MYVFIGQCDVKHIMTIRSVLNVLTNMTTYITVRSIGLAVILGTMPSSTIHNCEYSIYIVCMCRICSTQTCPNMHSWTNLILYKKNHFDSTKKLHERDWQHTCHVWWTYFSTDSRQSYWHQLCSSHRQLVPLFIWGRFQI